MKPLLFLLAYFVSFTVTAENLADHSQPNSHQIQLPDDIRLLVRQEMNELKKGMESLVFLVVSAQWLDIEKLAASIENTFIMKKALSKEQMQQLHSSLPAAFKQYDKTFHGYAGKLSAAAKAHDLELVQYYRYKMNEACTGCHSKFATHRFTGFNQPPQ
ncbi:MAG: cytochrome c [Pseudomonadales bacterium]|nr:cytochrome c [Pseudomonadales bacterium]